MLWSADAIQRERRKSYVMRIGIKGRIAEEIVYCLIGKAGFPVVIRTDDLYLRAVRAVAIALQPQRNFEAIDVMRGHTEASPT